jgi:hypothetical protein
MDHIRLTSPAGSFYLAQPRQETLEAYHQVPFRSGRPGK